VDWAEHVVAAYGLARRAKTKNLDVLPLKPTEVKADIPHPQVKIKAAARKGVRGRIQVTMYVVNVRTWTNASQKPS
jgi:hypothetical protein